MKYIGLDVGSKRIGVARGNSDTRIAIPVGFINVDGSEWQRIAQMARQNGTDRIIVGLPRSVRGNETAQSRYIRSFTQTLLKQSPHLKVRFQDETFTSVEAENRLKARQKTYQKGDIDAEAATIILQDFLETCPKDLPGAKTSIKPAAAAVAAAATSVASQRPVSAAQRSPQRSVSPTQGTRPNPGLNPQSNPGQRPQQESPQGTTPMQLKSPQRPTPVSTQRPSQNYPKRPIQAPGAALISAQNQAKNASNSPQNANSTPKSAQKSAKQGKPKMKRALKWISGIVIISLIGAGGVLVALHIREQRRAERAARYAAEEAAMQAEVYDFTIRPGETVAEIRENLVEIGYDATEVDKALKAKYDYPMLNGRPRGATLEGFLFGETKQFYKSTPVTEVIDFFLSEMQKTIDENDLEADFEAQGLTLFEGITLASVVQKESPEAEMPTVAQVFYSRLNTGVPMGSDVTVSYAADQVDPNREAYSDNETALNIDSCYNTRVNTGLPCGPISNPSLDALLATAHPSDTSYFYFLTGDDGLMYYSYTEEEHIQNAAMHCQDLCQVTL